MFSPKKTSVKKPSVRTTYRRVKKTSEKKPSVRTTYRRVHAGTMPKTRGGVTRSGIVRRRRDGKLISLARQKAGRKIFATQRARNPRFAKAWDSHKFTKNATARRR